MHAVIADFSRYAPRSLLPVANAQRCLYRCLDLTRLPLPGAEAQHRHLLAVVQGHIGVLDRGVFVCGAHAAINNDVTICRLPLQRCKSSAGALCCGLIRLLCGDNECVVMLTAS